MFGVSYIGVQITQFIGTRRGILLHSRRLLLSDDYATASRFYLRVLRSLPNGAPGLAVDAAIIIAPLTEKCGPLIQHSPRRGRSAT